MHKAYKEYIWKNGKPYGKNLTQDLAGTTYQIIVDPYYKRFSLEAFKDGKFDTLIYDSYLFDFRYLKRPEHAQWRREYLSETAALIRDEVDRLILKEVYTFKNDLCIRTDIYTPRELLVASQKIFYKQLNDPFNGVALFDIAGKKVMQKTYEWDETTNAFSDLIEESWET